MQQDLKWKTKFKAGKKDLPIYETNWLVEGWRKFVMSRKFCEYVFNITACACVGCKLFSTIFLCYIILPFLSHRSLTSLSLHLTLLKHSDCDAVFFLPAPPWKSLVPKKPSWNSHAKFATSGMFDRKTMFYTFASGSIVSFKKEWICTKTTDHHHQWSSLQSSTLYFQWETILKQMIMLVNLSLLI